MRTISRAEAERRVAEFFDAVPPEHRELVERMFETFALRAELERPVIAPRKPGKGRKDGD